MWTTILSPKSLATLSSPLALYYKSYLAVAIGSSLADKVVRYSYAFSARMDEAATDRVDMESGEGVDMVITANVEEESEDLHQTLQSFFYPTLGILRGLIKFGFSEEEAEEIITSMLEFAPEELRHRSRS